MNSLLYIIQVLYKTLKGTEAGLFLVITGLCFFVLMILILIQKWRIYQAVRQKKLKIRALSRQAVCMSANEFLDLRQIKAKGKGGPLYINRYAFPGVYILHNVKKDMYYIGQAKNLVRRVSSHLSGKGNGDVYADFKYGDSFEVMLVPLKSSGFSDLNELECFAIDVYQAQKKLYNRKKGNHTKDRVCFDA